MAAIASLALAMLPARIAAQGNARTLHLPSPVLNVAVHDDLVVGCLGLAGTAFMTVDGDSSPTLVSIREDLPSLGAIFLPDDRMLIAGRDGKLYRVDVSEPSSPRKLNAWEVEGIPMSLTLRGSTLTVASGAAGVLVFDWKGDGCEPRLRGRYPFVDYSKEAHYGPGGRLYLADNRDTGLQVLDVSAPTRPARLACLDFGDFVDNVAVVGDLAVVGTRRRGLHVLDITEAVPRSFTQLPPARACEARVQAVEAMAPGTFAVAFGEGGTHIIRLCFREEKPMLRTVAVLPAPESPATSVAVMNGGRLVVGSLDGGITVWQPPDGCTEDEDEKRCFPVPVKSASP